VANRAGFEAWRQGTPFAGASLFDAAHAQGMTTALLGAPDYHALHFEAASIDVTTPVDAAGAPAALGAWLGAHPRTLAVVALGAARTGDRHAASAAAELAALATTIAALADAATGAVVLITSRGATTIDDPLADFYGPGTSRHVPLLVIGPNVRAGVVSGQPGAPVDLPATVLFAIGAPTTTDFATGTWATGATAGGIVQPLPGGALGGHALVRAFSLAAPTGGAATLGR
jgi:hypothetical protein